MKIKKLWSNSEQLPEDERTENPVSSVLWVEYEKGDIEIYDSHMDPEDVSFFRSLDFVDESIMKAYSQGFKDAMETKK